MAKFRLSACVVGGKYLGVVEADTEAEAIEKGYALDAASINLCHQCADECEDAMVDEIIAELEGG